MFDIGFIDEIAPEHTRTSCDDNNSNGNEYYNEFGYPRCVRCALLYRLRNHEWPHNAEARIEIRFKNGL